MSPPSPPPSIEITWQAGTPPPDLAPDELRTAVERFLDTLGRSGWGVSVLLAGDAELRELNRRFRGLDRPTDVLSWSYLPAEEAPAAGETGLLGELALSLERARAQAAENGWDLRTEVLRLLAHGCAHLAGYDHQSDAEEREMKAVEVRMLARIGLEGLYPA